MSRYCGECNFFSHESIDGYGWCDVTDREQQCSDQCTLNRENITDKQALRVLHYAQKHSTQEITQLHTHASGV